MKDTVDVKTDVVAVSEQEGDKIVNNDMKDITEEGSQAVEDAVNTLSQSARQDDVRMTEAARIALRRLIRERLGKNTIVEARIIRI